MFMQCNTLRIVHFMQCNTLQIVHFMQCNILRIVHFMQCNTLQIVHFMQCNTLQIVHFMQCNTLRIHTGYNIQVSKDINKYINIRRKIAFTIYIATPIGEIISHFFVCSVCSRKHADEISRNHMLLRFRGRNVTTLE